MAFRTGDGFKKFEVHTNSIIKARVEAIKILDSYPTGWQFSIQNGLSGSEHKTRVGFVIKGKNGTYLWQSLKNNRYDREYVLYKNGKLGKLLRRFRK